MMGDKRRLVLALTASLLTSMSYRHVLAGPEKLPPPELIEPGTAIAVRLSDGVRTTVSDGRIFSGEMDRQARDAQGRVTIPQGAFVELIVRRTSNNEYTLDLESIIVQGRRMGVQNESHALSATTNNPAEVELGDESLDRSAVDSAFAAAIVGAFAWNGGSEIWQDSGAMPRRDMSMATRGKTVKLPAKTVVVFRLNKPLRAGISDAGFSRNGQHFHTGYGTIARNTDDYEAGLQAGRRDKLRPATDKQTTVWNNTAVSDYQAGYERGFAETPVPKDAPNRIQIGADNYIRWQGPPAAQVYVRVDNQKRHFSADESGAQPAPWIRSGHKYVFTLVDQNGKEIARDENDLRPNRKR